MADELAMLTKIGVKDEAVEDKFSGLLRAMLSKRPEEMPFSPWGGGQAIEAVRFTGQLSQLKFALERANEQGRSGLRQTVEAFVQSVTKAVNGGESVSGGV